MVGRSLTLWCSLALKKAIKLKGKVLLLQNNRKRIIHKLWLKAEKGEFITNMYVVNLELVPVPLDIYNTNSSKFSGVIIK